MLKDLFSNRLFIGALAFFVLCVGGGLLYMWHVDRQGAEKLAERNARMNALSGRVNQQTTTAASPVAEQTPQEHFDKDDTFHDEVHPEQNPGVNPPQPDKSDKQLTELEKSLLDSGVDIYQLPRDSNGNLIRGPTGGIALVKNPVAPTQADVERFEKKRRLTERLAEITTELQKFRRSQNLSTEDALRVNDLLVEQLKVSQELGFKIQSKSGDPLVALELQRLKVELMANNPDGYPVSAAPRLIELNRKLHRHDIADALEKSYQKAIESGKSSFMLDPKEINNSIGDR